MNAAANDLPLRVPAPYRATEVCVEDLPSPIPDQPPVHQWSTELCAKGKRIHLMWWDGHPTRDLGPMVGEESWPCACGGRPGTITRTSVFMGRPQEVLVFHGHLPDGSRGMLFSTDLETDEFTALVQAIGPA